MHIQDGSTYKWNGMNLEKGIQWRLYPGKDTIVHRRYKDISSLLSTPRE
jgi:hypothetical protein